jgi:hypothetical protein
VKHTIKNLQAALETKQAEIKDLECTIEDKQERIDKLEGDREYLLDLLRDTTDAYKAACGRTALTYDAESFIWQIEAEIRDEIRAAPSCRPTNRQRQGK